MNTNDTIQTKDPEDFVVLGIASKDTAGGQGTSEEIGGRPVSGISEE